jgi:hypothetical protein
LPEYFQPGFASLYHEARRQIGVGLGQRLRRTDAGGNESSSASEEVTMP